ncbi:hypothetical protein ACFP7A_10160 [Sporolactobacillus kofuensis]|uniref:Uncharacterized protein n=1 Tax=Sporolactobacillus kofuensis TaxID=269672 RepID=A0ABW1WH26_9BACL|nr:hypothetical protein [Sporolactobacillus kofuensis]MCO7176238.1 hypothetical protein [Sporolactobacillus kofuensis]
MHEIMSLYPSSLTVELIITQLQKIGVQQRSISCYFFDPPNVSNRRNYDLTPFETSNKVDLGFIFATIFGVIFASLGFRLPLGPIIWGVTSSFIGFAIGYAMDNFFKIHYKEKPQSYVMIIIHCSQDQVRFVKKILTDYQALGITVID